MKGVCYSFSFSLFSYFLKIPVRKLGSALFIFAVFSPNFDKIRSYFYLSKFFKFISSYSLNTVRQSCSLLSLCMHVNTQYTNPFILSIYMTIKRGHLSDWQIFNHPTQFTLLLTEMLFHSSAYSIFVLQQPLLCWNTLLHALST